MNKKPRLHERELENLIELFKKIKEKE